MSFFSTGVFWMIEGVLLCLVLAGMKIWFEDRGISPPIWQWVLLVLWLALCGFTISFAGTSLGENEVIAAAKGSMIFGFFAVVSGAGIWRLVIANAAARRKDDQ